MRISDWSSDVCSSDLSSLVSDRMLRCSLVIDSSSPRKGRVMTGSCHCLTRKTVSYVMVRESDHVQLVAKKWPMPLRVARSKTLIAELSGTWRSEERRVGTECGRR